MRKARAILGHPVFWGVAATVVVACFGLWVAGIEHYDEDWVLRSNWEHFKTAAPNEIGDTLAGFAGALAFVWIIVTVWLQSKELAAQREELTLTRAEMTEQRKATQKMAESLASQAKIFEDENRQRLEARGAELLDQQLNRVLNSVHSGKEKREFLNQELSIVGQVANEVDTTGNEIRLFHTLNEALFSFVAIWEGADATQRKPLSDYEYRFFDVIQKTIQEIEGNASNLSAGQLQRIGNLELSGILERLSELKALHAEASEANE